METPQAVLDLVDQFECNRDAYRSSEYNETQARHEFIDPLENNKSLIQCQIDQLVYELYGLTDEEIRIVEEATRA